MQTAYFFLTDLLLSAD